MNKMELVNEIARRTRLSKSKVLEALNCAFDTIKTSLKKGQRVQLIGFGSFLIRERKARRGRNPQTGQSIEISARKVPAFSAGTELKAVVNK